MIKRIVSGIAAIALCLGLLQCKREDVILTGLDSIRPYSIAMPLFKANIGAKDLLSRIDTTKYIYVDETGLIHIQVDTSFTVEYNEIIDFGDIGTERFYDLGLVNKSTNAQIVFNDTLQISPNRDQTLDSLLVGTGVMSILLETPQGITGNYTLVFPEIKLVDGSPLTFSGDLGTSSSSSVDVAGALFAIFENYNGFSSMSYTLTINYETPSGLPTTDEVHLNIAVSNFVPEVMWGFFGNLTVLDIKESIALNVFENLNLVDVVQFKGLSLAFELENYFGIPFQITFDSMVFKRSSTNQEVVLQLPDDNTISVESAIYGNPVIPVIDSTVFDETNTNLDDAINLYPDKIYMEVKGEINQEGASDQNFIVNRGDNKVYLHAKFRVPFWFKTSEYNRTDTIGFDVRNIFQDSNMVDYVEYLQLLFDFENGFPFNISTQAYFTNKYGQIIDSLFVCEGASDERCDGEGRYIIWKAGTAQVPGVTKVDVKLDHDLVKKLYDESATQIFVNSRVSTGPIEAPDFVQIKVDNYIKMRFAFELKSQSTKL